MSVFLMSLIFFCDVNVKPPEHFTESPLSDAVSTLNSNSFERVLILCNVFVLSRLSRVVAIAAEEQPCAINTVTFKVLPYFNGGVNTIWTF